MPIYEVPEDAGPFAVVQASDRSFAVADVRALEAGIAEKEAVKLGLLIIPCRSEQQAEDVARQLNVEGDARPPTIQVDLLGP